MVAIWMPKQVASTSTLLELYIRHHTSRCYCLFVAYQPTRRVKILTYTQSYDFLAMAALWVRQSSVPVPTWTLQANQTSSLPLLSSSPRLGTTHHSLCRHCRCVASTAIATMGLCRSLHLNHYRAPYATTPHASPQKGGEPTKGRRQDTKAGMQGFGRGVYILHSPLIQQS